MSWVLLDRTYNLITNAPTAESAEHAARLILEKNPKESVVRVLREDFEIRRLVVETIAKVGGT